ncbi:FliI/YscN family ATPase [Candidatus Sumerlaeota bacterium]|nr:FliI/YscN family ATPase [Candidatus Sumerlaeota bacterium]
MGSCLQNYERTVEGLETIQASGKVTQVVGTVIEGHCPDASVGRLCEIYSSHSDEPVFAEIVGFREDKVILMPLGAMRGLHPGSRIVAVKQNPTVRVGPGLMGRVLNGLGRPIDGKDRLDYTEEFPIYNAPINPFERQRIEHPLDVGVRAINGLLTCAIGQRVGIMSGSGVGKSVLLGMMARYTKADINVIGLIGERGREVREFLEKDLGEEGLKRSVVVVATSDSSPLERVHGAFVATALARWFSAQGRNVMLMMDSVTRLAMAQREIGLAIGEPPTTKGYTPSVLAMLPKLLEQAGMGAAGCGSVTGFYTVLVEGDDMNDPIADAVRSILDGHIVLSRDLADKHHFPAIDVLRSKSRLMVDVVANEHFRLAGQTLSSISAYQKAETLINIGAYKSGANPEVDQAIRDYPHIIKYLKQDLSESADFQSSLQDLVKTMQAGRKEQQQQR